jgi:ribosomal-protein-alanine N-acetyltransferase
MRRAGAKTGAAKPPVLTARGSRVYLRPVSTADAREFVALQRASRGHYRGAAAPTETIEQFRKNFAQWTSPGNVRFLVCLQQDDCIVGDVALSQISLGRLRSAYLGYAVGAPYAGHGYMQEALALALGYAFRVLRLNRVEANIQPWNQRSTALARRMGFALEGYSRRYLKISNTWRDHQRWALLARDWKPVRKSALLPQSAEAEAEIEIRDLTLHDIAAFAILRHQIAREGDFMLREPNEVAATRETFAEQVAQTLTDPMKKRILALHRGRAIGFISAARGDSNRARHSAHFGIAIAAAYTGRGVGKRLMDALETWARATGVLRLDLSVMVHNERAIALYQRCGFAIEGRARGEFLVNGELVDAYQMGKILD